MKKLKKIKITGTSERPRLIINKSNYYLTSQIIDDEKGITLFGYSSKSLKLNKNTEAAKKLGEFMVTEIKKLRYEDILVSKFIDISSIFIFHKVSIH